MDLFPPQLIQEVRRLATRGSLRPWPGILVNGALDSISSRIEKVVGENSVFRDSLVKSWGAGDARGLCGLGMFWAVSLAERAGWRLSRSSERFAIVELDGHEVALVPVPVTDDHDPQDRIQRLEETLRPIFGPRRWAMIVRRRLPFEFDVGKLVEPVRQWLAAVDRGRWDGDYAIYEDEALSLELRIVAGEVGRGVERGMVLRVPNGDLEDRLDDALRCFLEAMESEDLPSDIPLVAVMVRGDAWRLPRGLRMEPFFGKLQAYSLSADGKATLSFERPDDGVFGEPRFSRIGAVWWLGADRADALTPIGWSDENPWANVDDVVPRFPGRRLELVTAGPEEEGSPVTMTWNDGGQVATRPSSARIGHE